MATQNAPSISRYPVPKLEDLPEDIRARILEVQEKAGFIPNVFHAFSRRPEEFRASGEQPRRAVTGEQR